MTITVGITTGGMLHVETVKYLISLINKDRKYEVKLLTMISNTSAMMGMEKIMNEVLDSGADYLHIIDSDIAPPPGALDKLLSDNKDVVISPLWHYDRSEEEIHVNVHRTFEFNKRIFKPNENGLEQIAAGSVSCALIHRNVLQKFRDKGESFQFWSPFIHEMFKESQGDNIFFLKANKLGVEAYVDWDVKGVRHVKQADLSTGILNKWLNNLNRGR